MRVLHIISSLSRASGGPSRSSQGLVAAECRAGVDARIYSFDNATPWIEGVPRSGLLNVDQQSLKQFDIVHIHGLWDLRLHDVAVKCREANVPYVIAPRGMLEPWSLQQKWLKKRIARCLYQDRDLVFAAALHATAESEAEQLRKLGFENPIIVSPNGVNVPNNFSHVERVEKRRVLFVSRMHPKKGVLELVEAWGEIFGEKVKVKGEGGGEGKLRGEGEEGWMCELVYTVNGDFEREYEAKVKKRILELGMSYQDTDGTIHSSTSPLPSPAPNFIFTGALNDDEKWKAYARADLFVLPTYSENFGIVIAEALWAGMPVITTKSTPWKELEDRSCGWWIDIGVDSLTKAFEEGISLSDAERREMGLRGRKLIAGKYTWDAVVKAMVEGYGEVLNGGA